MICPNCKNKCNINEQVKYCNKCGYIFIDLLNIHVSLNNIGNRRSLENVDMD